MPISAEKSGVRAYHAATSETEQQDARWRVSAANMSCGAYIYFSDHSLRVLVYSPPSE